MKIKIITTNYDDTTSLTVFDSNQVIYMYYKEDSYLEIVLPYNNKIIVDEKNDIFVTNEKKQSCPIPYKKLYEVFYKGL